MAEKGTHTPGLPISFELPTVCFILRNIPKGGNPHPVPVPGPKTHERAIVCLHTIPFWYPPAVPVPARVVAFASAVVVLPSSLPFVLPRSAPFLLLLRVLLRGRALRRGLLWLCGCGGAPTLAR